MTIKKSWCFTDCMNEEEGMNLWMNETNTNIIKYKLGKVEVFLMHFPTDWLTDCIDGLQLINVIIINLLLVLFCSLIFSLCLVFLFFRNFFHVSLKVSAWHVTFKHEIEAKKNKSYSTKKKNGEKRLEDFFELKLLK